MANIYFIMKIIFKIKFINIQKTKIKTTKLIWFEITNYKLYNWVSKWIEIMKTSKKASIAAGIYS